MKTQTVQTGFRVTIIRSERATQREKLEYPAIESQVGDYISLEAAQKAYMAVETGIETDKELYKLTEIRDANGKFMSEDCVLLESTY